MCSPVELSSCGEVECAAVEGSVVAASYATHTLRVWGDQGECQEYQVESCRQMKIVGETLYMLGKDSRVRVLHMVLGRVVSQVLGRVRG